MTTRQFRGRIVSTTSISLEKRLTILPIGVVSNISIGQCMILVNNVSCKIWAQNIQPRAKVKEDMKCTSTTKKKVTFGFQMETVLCFLVKNRALSVVNGCSENRLL